MSMSIRSHFCTVVILSTLLAVAGVSTAAILIIRSQSDKDIKRLRQEEVTASKTKLVNLVGVAHEIIQQKYNSVTSHQELVKGHGRRLEDMLNLAYGIAERNLEKPDVAFLTRAVGGTLNEAVDDLHGKLRKELASPDDVALMRAIKDADLHDAVEFVWVTARDGKKVIYCSRPGLADGKEAFLRRIKTQDDRSVLDSSVVGKELLVLHLERELVSVGQVRTIQGRTLGVALSTALVERELRNLTKNEIRKLRYDNGIGYFWITTDERPIPHMVMHAIKSELDGKLLDADAYNCAEQINDAGNVVKADANLFQLMVEISEKTGSGFVGYQWPKPNGNGDLGKKLSYVKRFQPWNWIIGTGIYLDDAITKAKEKAKQEISTLTYDEKEGYFWINTNTLDPDKGVPRMVMHPMFPKVNGKWDERLLDAEKYYCVGPEKKNLFTEMVKKCKDNKGGLVEYQWPKPKEDKEKLFPKISYVRSFQEWGWVVGSGVYTDHIDGLVAAKKSVLMKQTKHLANSIITIAVVLILLTILACSYTSRKLADPIKAITVIANKVADEDLKGAVQGVEAYESGKKTLGSELNETIHLMDAIRTMTDKLNSLVSRTQQSGIQLTSSSTQISAGAKKIEGNLAEQVAATNEVLATTTQISGVARELADIVNNVVEKANQTAQLAGVGKNDLNALSDTMLRLAKATGLISRRLREINDKTDKINLVMNTITKVADQTNLLSLNASIEAEKAGEYGIGFSVVAREIRRLADQTAVATLDIEHTVENMREAVFSGVDDMEKYANEVTEIVEEVSRIGTQQEKIIEHVEELRPAFEEVNEAMTSQVQGAEQIRDAIVMLSESAEGSVQAISEFKDTASNLRTTATEMQDEISRFQVSS